MNKTVLILFTALITLSPAVAASVTYLQIDASTTAGTNSGTAVSSHFDSGVLIQTLLAPAPLFSLKVDNLTGVSGSASENGFIQAGAIHGYVSAEGVQNGGSGVSEFSGMWVDTLTIGGLTNGTPVTLRITSSLHSLVSLNTPSGTFFDRSEATASLHVLQGPNDFALNGLDSSDANAQSNLSTSHDFVFTSGASFIIEQKLVLHTSALGSSLFPDVLATADASNTSNAFIDVLTPGATLSSASGAGYSSTAAPEPSSLVMMGCGLLAYSFFRQVREHKL